MSKSGGKWKGGDGFEVGHRGSAEARAKEKMEEPLVQPVTNFRRQRDEVVDDDGNVVRPAGFDQDGKHDERQTFPAIYGVDLQARRREKILSEFTKNQLGNGGQGGDAGKKGELAQMLGDRQVMLDDKTTAWLLQEEDRMALIAKDKYFEESAIASGLFSTPHGLEYLHKIRPQYFKDRRKLAKWVSNAQLKLFDLRFNGVHTPQDFDFMYMIQSLGPDQKEILKHPVWLLNQYTAEVGADSWFKKGLFARSRAPDAQVNASFAGMGSRSGSGVSAKTSSSGSNFFGGIFGGTSAGSNNANFKGFGVGGGYSNLFQPQ